MLYFPCKSKEFGYQSTWSIEFTEDFTGKYTEILTHAQTVCTRPFSTPLKKGPGYEATEYHADNAKVVNGISHGPQKHFFFPFTPLTCQCYPISAF